MRKRPPLTPESAIRRGLAGGPSTMLGLVVQSGHKRTTLLLALEEMIADGEVRAERDNGRAPIVYSLTRAGQVRRRADERYLTEER